MANLLDTCATIVGLLFPLCDALANCNVMQEERAYFMSPVFSYFASFSRFARSNDQLLFTKIGY